MQATDVRDGIFITAVELISFSLARKFLLRSLQPSLKDASEDRKYNEDMDDDAPLLPTLNGSSRPSIASIQAKLSLSNLKSLTTFTTSTALNISRWAFSMVFAQAAKIIVIAMFNIGNMLQTPAVEIAFKIALGLLLGFVIFLIPYLQCFLFVRLRQASTAAIDTNPPLLRTIKISLIPFACYLLLFSTIPLPLSNASSLLGKALVRSVGMGVIILAVLSGIGVVSTTFMFLHAAFVYVTCLTTYKSIRLPVSVEDIETSEKALNHVQNQLDEVKEKVHNAEITAHAKMAEDEGMPSVIPKWMTSWTRSPTVPGPLRMELNGLQSLESQMVIDLNELKFKYDRQEFSKTIKGKLYVFLGHAFAVYCIARVIVSLINLMFRRGSTESSPDYVSKILGGILAHLFNNPDSSAVYAKQISVVSIGAIIISNVKALLLAVNRIFKKIAGTTNVAGNSSTRSSTSFLIFLLSQLMGSFFLTMLVQLNTSLSANTTFTLLNSLPAVDLFGTAFDAPFVISVALTTIIKKL
ncbi:hypothetical protein E3Q23_02214 [Wallemia mellicola]|uniref:Abscisic acid G-protein coupled receptor-like domain-containing protein n=1 Tax=Wallemia mellicola TaxID=1708541 RepID=A0A4T0MU53_9BASI|nr:hypothetical protein E3Q24_02254 [Wallemia mellicola]TIB75822.1 hypothetical protein E3Q23_02214 [Wallemia mellicola]TIB84204.1 hypothetical protein E3Q21_02480 [Wallemia mellicola]TIB87345.1 hypothetical protein E3Q20_02473 [Wallemia mellicola]TIC05150.1 hypothetical protein E3Q16_02401 [Wallemia mellicola]